MSWFFGKSRRSSQTDTRRLVNDLAEICGPQYEQLKNGQVVLSLSIQSLQLILAAFADCKSVASLSRDDAKRRERLRVCLHDVRSAKLFGTSATLQGRIELSVFENLVTLSLFKVPIHLIDMTSALRRRIETLVCTRSLTQLGELLRQSRTAQSTNSANLPDTRVSSHVGATDTRWRALDTDANAQPESNRLSGGAPSAWHDGSDESAPEVRTTTIAEDCNWDALVELHVVYNTIESLDASLLSCTRLRVLDLSHNGLRRIGPALLPLIHLQHVDLSYNFLTEFPRFCSASQRSLRSVALHYNMIETLDSRVKSNNSPVADVDFRRFESLLELNLAQNLFANVQGLRPLVVLPRLSRLALCGNPLEFAAGSRYRARVLAYAVALHCISTLVLDGTVLTPAEIREAERMRCAGDPLLRATDFVYRPLLLPEIEDDNVTLDGTQTDVDESVERVNFVTGRSARSDCDSPTREDSLATTGPNSRKRRKRRVVRPRLRADDANESSDGLTVTDFASVPAASVESEQASSRLLTKEDMDAVRKKLVNSASGSWLNGLPQNYRDALNAQPEENASPASELPPQPQHPDSASSDGSLRIIVGQSPPRQLRNDEFASVQPSVNTPGSLDIDTSPRQFAQEPPAIAINTDGDDDKMREENKLSLSHIEYAPSSTPLEQSAVSVYETPCAAATQLATSNTTDVANSYSQQKLTPPKEQTSVSQVAAAKVNGQAEESHTSTVDESRHTDNESERTTATGGQSTRSQSKRRIKTDASTRKRSVSIRTADETFLVTPVPASFLLSSAPTAVMESTQLFLVVNVALAERGVQLLDVDSGEPIEWFDLRKLRYAARFRDSAVPQAGASTGHLPAHILALAFADHANAGSRILRRFFEVENDAAAAQLLALFEAPMAINCSFMCVTCRQTFVWLDESLVYSEDQHRDGFAGPSACPRCGGHFVKEADSPSLPLPPSLNDNDGFRVQPRGTTPVRSRSRKSSYLARKRGEGDTDSVISFSLSQSQPHSRASSPLSSRLNRLRSVKQFQFDEESFKLVDSDLTLLFSLNLLEQDEEVQLLVRSYVVLDTLMERSMQVTERNRTIKKKGTKQLPEIPTTQTAPPPKQQVFAALVAITARRLLVLEVRVLPEMTATNANGPARDGEPDDAQGQTTFPLSNCEVVRLAWQSGLKELHRVVPQPQFGIVSFLFGTSMLNIPLHVALVDLSCFDSLIQALQTHLTDAEVLEVQEDTYMQETTLHLAQVVWSKVADLDSSMDTSSRQTREALPVCLLPNVQSEAQLANVTGQFALLVVSRDACVLLQHADCVPKRESSNGIVTPSGSLPRKALIRNARTRARRQAEDTLSSFSADASLASSLDSNNGCSLPSESAVLSLTRDLCVSAVLKLTDLNIDAFCLLEREVPFDSTLLTSLDVLRITFENEASGQKQIFWLAPLVADGKRRLLDAIQEPWHALFGVPLELLPLRLA